MKPIVLAAGSLLITIGCVTPGSPLATNSPQ
jgi:hypothetical protein